MIPDEAVEAAALAQWAWMSPIWTPARRWDELPPSAQTEHLTLARNTLEAAVPHMMAVPAQPESLYELMHHKITDRLPPRPTKDEISAYVDAAVSAAIKAGYVTNPYRSQT